VITTGGSSREVVSLIQEQGFKVAAVGCLVDRSGGKVDMGVPLKALLNMEIESYPPEVLALVPGRLAAGNNPAAGHFKLIQYYDSVSSRQRCYICCF
jgi:orotate phosphoribosyltransferase